MDQPPRRVDLLAELEARQDEVLEQLDALNARLEKLLAEFTPERPAAPVPAPAPAKVAA
jgi:hypothetical protein